MRRCVLTEGETPTLSEALEGCDAGVSVEELKKAVLDMRATLGYFRRGAVGGIALDTPRPDVVGDRAHTGFWVGVYRYAGGVELVIKPRVSRYYRMVERTDEVLRDVYPLYLLSKSLVATNVPNIVRITRIIWEARGLIQREPKYFRAAVEASSGKLIVRGDRELLVKNISVPNVWLASSVLLTLSNLSQFLRGALRYTSGLPEGVGKALELYISSLESALKVLHKDAEEEIPHLWVEDLDPGDYFYLPAIARRVGSEFFLIPSTKLYETYVLALTVRTLKRDGLAAKVLRGGIAVDVEGDGRVYFNKAPTSKLIRRIAGIAPRPDIVVESGRNLIVVEAKYRRLDERRLRRADAIRLVAYLADVARDHRLRGVVAALEPPHQAGGCPAVSANIDSTQAEIRFSRVNPDYEKSEEEFIECIRGILSTGQP
ncbi:conserved hypothetical protein [Pyrobaculum islandicum DSM 4184]|uniref:McrBC 5-methylcytosine restriction system component-like protein n=1 Tax=Pyrobaculum islandicum (strain DSM 4184 / JCM 9189 / GEO3) TaxID=384616 RepID=A1RVV7_PYRIL|nr:hypothetical protein [Pyrobaculum islandicum]ABL89089.1 conserved hypothetical protein [Pyrobaculum islandicum DSM 4184]